MADEPNFIPDPTRKAKVAAAPATAAAPPPAPLIKQLVKASSGTAAPVYKKKHEAEDWCDQQLAKFEIVLDRTTKMVHAGRDKLRSVPQAPAAPLSAEDQAADDAANAFFDQDL